VITDYIEEYEIFPALYDANHFRENYEISGLNITEREPYFSERGFISYVTYIKLKQDNA